MFMHNIVLMLEATSARDTLLSKNKLSSIRVSMYGVHSISQQFEAKTKYKI